MSIVEIRVDIVEPFAEGQAFGRVGSYLRNKGIAKGEIDPAAPENSVITDLDKAPRNAQDRVLGARHWLCCDPRPRLFSAL